MGTENGSVKAVKVGFTIIGTTIGAGFASGREIWEFFGSYGADSQYSLLIAMLLFLTGIYVILWISSAHQTSNYYELLERVMGRQVASLFDVLIMLYLLSMSTVMFAGSGTTFAQWNFTYMGGVWALAAAVFLVLLFDVRGLMNMNSLLIPVLVGVLMFVCIHYLFGIRGLPVEVFGGRASWPSGVTYAALNVVPLIAVVSTLGRELKSKREVLIAAGSSTAGLGAVAFLMNSALIQAVKDIPGYEMPLFSLLKYSSGEWTLLVSVILWLAIYTTALSGVHGIVFRVSSLTRTPVWLTSLVIIICIVPLSRFGFGALVSFLYPFFGVLNLFVLGLLILYPINRMMEK